MSTYEDYIDLTYMEHQDYEKCGQCWKQKLISDVAKEQKAAGKPFDLVSIFEEADKRWKETSLFKEVTGLLKSGLTIDEAQALMEAKGIQI